MRDTHTLSQLNAPGTHNRLGRHREDTADATRCEGGAVTCTASATTGTDTAPEPSTLTTISRLA